MPGILALDPATVIGWAHAEPGASPTWGSQRLGREGCDTDDIAEALGIFLDARIAIFCPQWIVREQTFDGPNPSTNYILHGIAWQIDHAAKQRGIGCRKAETKVFTRHFTGQGTFPGKDAAQRRAAKKRAMVARCHMLGWKVTDNNQADALGLLLYAEAVLFPEMRLKMARPAGPLFVKEVR